MEWYWFVFFDYDSFLKYFFLWILLQLLMKHNHHNLAFQKDIRSDAYSKIGFSWIIDTHTSYCVVDIFHFIMLAVWTINLLWIHAKYVCLCLIEYTNKYLEKCLSAFSIMCALVCKVPVSVLSFSIDLI